MSPPYELSYVEGRFTVNGLALSPPKPPARRQYHYSRRERAQIAFCQSAADLVDSLRAAGVSREQQGEALRSMCLSSPLVASVTVISRAVTMRFHDGQRFQIALAGKWIPPAHPVTRAQMEMGRLEQVRRLLETGSTVFILSENMRITASPEKADAFVSQARAGRKSDDMEPALGRQLRSPIPLVRVKPARVNFGPHEKSAVWE